MANDSAVSTRPATTRGEGTAAGSASDSAADSATGGGDAAPAAPTSSRDVVEVRLPAHSAYVSVLRTVSAALAARMDFTLDEIEDLRIAVDEGCAILLAQAPADADLTCVFEPEEGALLVRVTVPSPSTKLPRRDSFAWTVLTALAGDVDAAAEDGRMSLTLRKHQQARQQSNQPSSQPSGSA